MVSGSSELTVEVPKRVPVVETPKYLSTTTIIKRRRLEVAKLQPRPPIKPPPRPMARQSTAVSKNRSSTRRRIDMSSEYGGTAAIMYIETGSAKDASNTPSLPSTTSSFCRRLAGTSPDSSSFSNNNSTQPRYCYRLWCRKPTATTAH